MSNKKGLGRNQLEFNKVTPKFLQDLKKKTEVDINAKFKEYVEQDDDNDNLQQPDELEQEAIQKAIEEDRKAERLYNEKQREEEDIKRKQIEDERNKRIEQDRLEEEQAKLEGRERKIIFQKPTTSMVTKSKLKDTTQSNLKKTTESVKKTILNNNNSSSTKSKIDSIKSNKKKKSTGNMLSFNMDDDQQE